MARAKHASGAQRGVVSIRPAAAPDMAKYGAGATEADGIGDLEQADSTWRGCARHRAHHSGRHGAAAVGRFPRTRRAPFAEGSGARGARVPALLTRDFRCASGSKPHLCGWSICPQMRPGFSSRNTRSNGVEPDPSPPDATPMRIRRRLSKASSAVRGTAVRERGVNRDRGVGALGLRVRLEGVEVERHQRRVRGVGSPDSLDRGMHERDRGLRPGDETHSLRSSSAGQVARPHRPRLGAVVEPVSFVLESEDDIRAQHGLGVGQGAVVARRAGSAEARAVRRRRRPRPWTAPWRCSGGPDRTMSPRKSLATEPRRARSPGALGILTKTPVRIVRWGSTASSASRSADLSSATRAARSRARETSTDRVLSVVRLGCFACIAKLRVAPRHQVEQASVREHCHRLFNGRHRAGERLKHADFGRVHGHPLHRRRKPPTVARIGGAQKDARHKLADVVMRVKRCHRAEGRNRGGRHAAHGR